jgi:predicted metal-dependent phosphoesterase TrpH
MKKGNDIRVIAGIEISCSEGGREIHILGYYLDPDNDELQAYEVEKRAERINRAKLMVEKLNALKVSVSFGEVEAIASGATIGRPHIAAAMVRNGSVPSIQKAFDNYLDSSRPAYVPRTTYTVRQAVTLVRNAGGVAIVAHPARTYMDPRMFLSLIASGIDGIEVYHPSHWTVTREYYRMLAVKHGLLITGGSDFHGSRDYDEKNFGLFGVSEEMTAAIHTRAIQRRLHGK